MMHMHWPGTQDHFILYNIYNKIGPETGYLLWVHFSKKPFVQLLKVLDENASVRFRV